MVRHLSFIPLFIFSITFLFLFSTCKKDEPIIDELQGRSFPQADERLWDLFEAFEIEGAKRGFEIDLAKAAIFGEIKPISDAHVAGRCTYSSILPGRVTIDTDFWTNSSDNFKEFIVFHELGHCYLERDHREDIDALGFCVSIMRSGLEDCQDNYSPLTREQYIDELFNPEKF